MGWFRMFFAVFAFSALLVPEARTQETESSCPPNFVFLRTGTASSVFAFYTYDLCNPLVGSGSFVLVAGTIIDPHGSGYKELPLVGAGLNFVGTNARALPFLVVSNASDAWYLEPSAFLWFDNGTVAFSAFWASYVPLEGAGAWQNLIDPLQGLYRPLPNFGFGASYSLFDMEGVPAEHGLGPAVWFGTPATNITLDYLFNLSNKAPEVRVTLKVAF